MTGKTTLPLINEEKKPLLVLPATHAGAGRAERVRAATFAGLGVQVGAPCCRA